MYSNISRHRTSRLAVCLLLCLFIIAGSFEPAFAAASASGDPVDSYDEQQTSDAKEAGTLTEDLAEDGVVLSDYRDISKALSYDEEQFASITVDPSDARIVKDGEEGSLEQEFDAENKEVKKAVKSEENMEDFLKKQDGDTIYEVDEEANGDLEITAPYQTKRIIIDSLIENDTLGAAHVFYNTLDHETILEFDTDQETREAYDAARRIYGQSHCFVDQVLYLNDDANDDSVANVSASGRFYSWGTRYMGMDQLKATAAAYGYNRQVKVAVIDSGVYRSHPMFAGGRIHEQSWNFIVGSPDYSDLCSHGSHVSGIIADATPANVKIVMLKVTNKKGVGSLYVIKNALRYAVNRKVDVINMSMGVTDKNAPYMIYLNDVIEKAWYKGIPVCCSSGNDGINVSYTYPANQGKTITVGAINSDGSRGNDVKNGIRYFYSNYGKKVDFAAPGTNIISAGMGLYYVYKTGTSMSAPHITAAVAYLKMMEPDISVTNIRKQLKSMCKDLGPKGKDRYYGWGCPMMKDLFVKGITYKGATPPAVGQVKLTSLKNRKQGVRIAWKKEKKADKYKVYRKTAKGKYKNIAVLSKSRGSYLDKKAKQGKKYVYKVKAVHAGIGGKFSVEKSIVRLKTVTDIKSARKSKTSILLKWKKMKGVKEYQVRYSAKPSMKKNNMIIVNKTRKKITGLKGKYIYCQIRARKTTGGISCYSSWSAREKIKLR